MFADLALSEPLRLNVMVHWLMLSILFLSLSLSLALSFKSIQTLLQSSASRKTQKKKKKKVSRAAVWSKIIMNAFMRRIHHSRHVKQKQNLSSNPSCLWLQASKTVESATGQAMETEAAE